MFYHLGRVTTKPTYWVCDQHGSRPACASKQSDQDPCCSLTNPITSRETDSEQYGSWSDCTDGQADLKTCWSQTHYVGFVMTRLIYCLLFKSTYDHELQALQEIIQEKVVLLLNDYDNSVKRALLDNGITRLCVFFGRQKGRQSFLFYVGFLFKFGLIYCDYLDSFDLETILHLFWLRW
jgi:hypothetical protein